MNGFDWLTVVLLILVLYLLRCCARLRSWLAYHHRRNAELEQAVCRLENYVYQSPINTNNMPPADQRFCKGGGTPPDGWGGNPPPGGF